VYTSYPCSKLLQSYPGMVHGGMVAALLDAAMTNCLFSRGVTAVTGDLRVRFRQPVKVDCVAEITAAVVRTRGRLRHLTADLLQDGKPMARATATFVVRRPAHAQDRAGNAPDHRESGLPSDAVE
jgi:acyl-coenzyme A thioesterase PaaI-like protein